MFEVGDIVKVKSKSVGRTKNYPKNFPFFGEISEISNNHFGKTVCVIDFDYFLYSDIELVKKNIDKYFEIDDIINFLYKRKTWKQ